MQAHKRKGSIEDSLKVDSSNEDDGRERIRSMKKTRKINRSCRRKDND